MREKWALGQSCQLPVRSGILIGICFMAPPRVQGRWCWPALRGWGGSIWERKRFPRSRPRASGGGQDRLGSSALSELRARSFSPHVSRLGLPAGGGHVDFI